MRNYVIATISTHNTPGTATRSIHHPACIYKPSCSLPISDPPAVTLIQVILRPHRRLPPSLSPRPTMSLGKGKVNTRFPFSFRLRHVSGIHEGRARGRATGITFCRREQVRVCRERVRRPINHRDKIARDTLMCVLMYRRETILPRVKGSGVLGEEGNAGGNEEGLGG
ncbi:hypothetical protein E2C01_056667 [Portunus trituberculatus]|uniref:Uncharacterized protein n=1 Tax=Portunus trituberculatus TaxID=210409 RepID=A0A5B7GQY5_PORTR|nr:hypothetical protein [Portunus trituberculatus]